MLAAFPLAHFDSKDLAEVSEPVDSRVSSYLPCKPILHYGKWPELASLRERICWETNRTY